MFELYVILCLRFVILKQFLHKFCLVGGSFFKIFLQTIIFTLTYTHVDEKGGSANVW